MILPFPYRPEDWLAIWRKTHTMTLRTVGGEPITITIASVAPVLVDECGHLEAVRVIVADGSFFVSFGESHESLDDKLLFKIDCRDPKKGRWQVPQWYIDERRERAKDKS